MPISSVANICAKHRKYKNKIQYSWSDEVPGVVWVITHYRGCNRCMCRGPEEGVISSVVGEED